MLRNIINVAMPVWGDANISGVPLLKSFITLAPYPRRNSTIERLPAMDIKCDWVIPSLCIFAFRSAPFPIRRYTAFLKPGVVMM